ncbi:hypothetical protein BHE74_00042997 [Ensete ventricosum]|nr:hypothetical protein BHE74_00042997 [Ensete ventricosum]
MTQYDRPPSKCSTKFTLQKHPSRLASLPSTSSAAMAARRSRNMKHEDAKEGDDLSPENSSIYAPRGFATGTCSMQVTRQRDRWEMTIHKETVVGQSSMAAISNKQRHFPYPICSRRRLLHPLAGIVPLAAFVLSAESTCKGHRPLFGSCSIIDIHVVGLAALRSTSSAPVAAIAGVGDTIGLNVACHRLTIRSLLQLSQQQLDRFSSSVHIPLYIVSTPPKKGPQHCGPEVREEREAHLHYNGFLIFSFGDYSARCRPSLLE